VVEVLEKLDLPERALGIHVVVEGVGYLLDGHHLPRLVVHHGAARSRAEFSVQKSPTQSATSKQDLLNSRTPLLFN
jgi:hypothetical protein